MNIAGIRYEHFSAKDYNVAKELLSYDVDAGENILRVLTEEPELFITAFIEDKLVALAQVNEPASQSYLTVFVAPQFRRQGIGSANRRSISPGGASCEAVYERRLSCQSVAVCHSFS